jgi:3-deoxy-7-phosphoheptulonate synthase
MVILMHHEAKGSQIDETIARLNEMGFKIHRSQGVNHTVLGIIGDVAALDVRDVQLMPGVADAYRVSVPYKLVSREFQHEPTKLKIKDIEIGGKEVVVIAGPCSVESWDQTMESCSAVGPLSRVPHLMPFRALGKRDLKSCEKRQIGINCL